MHVRVMLVDSKDATMWHTKTKRAPKFAQASVHASSTGELFVAYSYTNYGYDQGEFELAAGPRPRNKITRNELMITF